MARCQYCGFRGSLKTGKCPSCGARTRPVRSTRAPKPTRTRRNRGTKSRPDIPVAPIGAKSRRRSAAKAEPAVSPTIAAARQRPARVVARDQQGPHAKISLRARPEFASVPGDESPLMGMVVEVEAEGQPIVDRHAGPVAHVILALDLSASMNTPDKYPVLRQAIFSMLADLKKSSAANVLVSVVAFSMGAEVFVEATLARQVDPSDLFARLQQSPLCFGRYTDVAGALRHAGRIARDQCAANRTMPVRLYLLTDGRPQDQKSAREAAGLIGQIPADMHALAFGVDADVTVLQELFAGKRGGTIKPVRRETLGNAFERIAEVAQRVVATRCHVALDLAPGVVGGNAFRFRPARVRFPAPAFVDGKQFKADLGTVETSRSYSLLIEFRPPETEDEQTVLGTFQVQIPGYGGPITEKLELRLPRTAAGTELGEQDAEVRTARDILDAIDDADPETALRALRLRRRLYEREKRDPGLLAILDRAIMLLETSGSLEGLTPGEQATLMAHTATSSGDDWDEILNRAG